MNQLLFVVGVLIVLLTVTSVLFTLVLPRQPAGIERATLAVNRTVRLAFVVCRVLGRELRDKDATGPDRAGGIARPAAVLGGSPGRRLRPDANGDDTLVLRRVPNP